MAVAVSDNNIAVMTVIYNVGGADENFVFHIRVSCLNSREKKE